MIAIGVRFGPPGWLYRKRGKAEDHQGGVDWDHLSAVMVILKGLGPPEFRYGYMTERRNSMVSFVAAGVCCGSSGYYSGHMGRTRTIRML